MKTILLTAMLTLCSSLSFCQEENTSPTYCFTETQLNEIYLIVQQSDYLKERLSATELSLLAAQEVINAINEQRQTQASVIDNQAKMINAFQIEAAETARIHEIQIDNLNANLQHERAKSRQSTWKASKTGFLVGVGAAVLGFIIIN